MKRMDFSCRSPSSTAICSSLDHRSMVRHRSISSTTPIFAPCSSRHLLPFRPENPDTPRRRSASVALSDLYKKPDAKKQGTSDLRRMSSSDAVDLLLRRRHSRSGSSVRLLNHHPSPPSAAPYVDWVSESAIVLDRQYRHKQKEPTSVDDHARRHSSAEPPKRLNQNAVVSSAVAVVTPRSVNFPDCPPKPPSPATSHDQVVELRVSIHCKGCEGKVRKHIAKMEGVTSFSIDVTTKKVTVKGNVTAMGVLASISKVKSAQLWSTSLASMQ